MNLKDMRQAFERKHGRAQELRNQIKQCRTAIKSSRQEYHVAEKAHALIQLVAQQTQSELEYQLSELPKLALEGVFDNPYGFDVSIDLSHGKTEANFWFVKQGARLNPKESAGQGAVDIAGTALRPSLWSLRFPHNRSTIILDEPFKHLKGVETNIRALEMLKGICKPNPEKKWPGLQIIMVADERAPREELINAADRVFEFTMKNNETAIKILK